MRKCLLSNNINPVTVKFMSFPVDGAQPDTIVHVVSAMLILAHLLSFLLRCFLGKCQLNLLSRLSGGSCYAIQLLPVESPPDVCFNPGTEINFLPHGSLLIVALVSHAF